MSRRHGASARIFADPHESERLRRQRELPGKWYRGGDNYMRRQWWHVVHRDRDQCRYCGSKTQLTFDHVIPRSRGGRTTYDNLVLACRDCNQRKGARTPEQAGMPLRSLEAM
jgi:hypothetical protein